MGVRKELAKMSVILGRPLMLARNDRKPRLPDEEGPKKSDDSEHQVWLHDAQRLRSKVGIIDMLSLQAVDLGRGKLDPGKDKYGSD